MWVSETSVTRSPFCDAAEMYGSGSRFGSMTIAVRTTGDAAAMLPALQRAVWEVNPRQAIYTATTMDALIATSLKERRFNLSLIGGFALERITTRVYDE